MTVHCSYQGLPVHACRFRRSRGWEADVSTVQFLARDFPKGFVFETPRPGDLARPRPTQAPGIDWTRRAPFYARRLHWVGDLVMAERDEGGREFVVRTTLYCIGVETARRDSTGKVVLVQARLVDERYFWSQGFLRRWSFSRAGLDGEVYADSTKPDGSLFTLLEVAQEAARSLFDRPELARAPESWSKLTPELEFAPFGSARRSLIRLAEEHGQLEAALSLQDGKLRLWRMGEGTVGHGEENGTPIPKDYFLHLSGAGQGEGTEALYPSDWIVVVGGVRTASVALGGLEPVLLIEGEPIPLTERTVRVLTKGKHGLTWLKAFVLVPQAWQDDAGIRSEVAQLLREQAWRLWRLPGVEQRVDARIPPERIEDLLSGLRQSTKRIPTTLPGPNAHLLPLRPRAEVVAGRRLPVQVEAYRFGSVQVALAPPQVQEEATKTRHRLKDLRFQIEKAARTKGDPSPWNQADWFVAFSERYAKPRKLWSLASDLQKHGVSYEQFMRTFNQARLLDRIAEVSPSLASDYDSELSKLYALDAAQGGLGSELWQIAKEMVAFEKDAAEKRDAFESVDEEIEEQAETLRKKIAGAVRKVAKRRQEAKRRSRSKTTQRRFTPQGATYLKNYPLKVDPHADVVSAELGIVRTSTLCGHVFDPAVPVAEATTFVPKAPRITFGAVVRPRLTRRPVTGAKGQDAVPAGLSDRETYYTAAFRRMGLGRVEPVPLERVPEGHGVVVRRPDLLERLPLKGGGNREVLDQTALAAARETAGLPGLVRSGHFVLARPWAIDCNGAVSGVEIQLRPKAHGFLTTVFLGSEARPLKSVGSSQVRTPEHSDAAARKTQ